MNRRIFLAFSALAALVPAWARAQSQKFQPVQDITPLVQQITHGKAARDGGIEMQLPQSAETGTSVPLHLKVDSPMSADDHVEALYVIAERNPRPLVATFH